MALRALTEAIPVQRETARTTDTVSSKTMTAVVPSIEAVEPSS